MSELYKFDTTKFLEIVDPQLIVSTDLEWKGCSPVVPEEAEEIIKLGEKMIQLCVDNGGVGLAAPQVGVYKRMFVWMNGNSTFQIVLNPSWVPQEKKKTNLVEACLSYPKQNFFLTRYKRIHAQFETWSPTENKIYKWKKDLSGERSYIFQHETDHLFGQTIATKGIDIKKIQEQKTNG